jgi:hypothetical protein
MVEAHAREAAGHIVGAQMPQQSCSGERTHSPLKVSLCCCIWSRCGLMRRTPDSRICSARSLTVSRCSMFSRSTRVAGGLGDDGASANAPTMLRTLSGLLSLWRGVLSMPLVAALLCPGM